MMEETILTVKMKLITFQMSLTLCVHAILAKISITS